MKKMLVFLLALAMIVTAVPASVMAEAAQNDGQLTLEDLKALNGDEVQIDLKDGLVSFVGGACTPSPVSSEEDARKVLDSMQTLLSGGAAARFEPWNIIQDAAGNRYYIFQQTHADTVVLGGAVKVIADAEGNMLGLTATVVTDLPDEAEAEGVTMEKAEAIVLEHEANSPQGAPELIAGMTARVVLPVALEADINEEDTVTRFVWSVYTTNPSANLATASDLPYLAHYVTMAGEYLYSLPTILPGDAAGASGFDASYTFQFMEPVPYTGYVDLADGTEQEITVELMRDTRTGMYYLGNIEHKIVVADCWEFLYNGGRVVLEYSPDNMEWDQTCLISLYNYCLAYDYYKEIGWLGADGEQTPIIVLKDFCDPNHVPIDNAAYASKYYGWQTFLASSVNNYSQCLDVCVHEFTHCVTHSVMTHNAYSNDCGAINEAISDIHGNICDMLMGKTKDTTWLIGENSSEFIRSMSEPHKGRQPMFSWDLHYQPNVKIPTMANDRGGVHSNSSLLNYIAYLLCEEGGMTLEEARAFWFAVDCTMVPGTDYPQLRMLLPWVLHTAHLDAYADCLARAIDVTRLGDDTMPETLDSNRAMLDLELPDSEVFTNGNWTLSAFSVNLDRMVSELTAYGELIRAGKYDSLPEPLKKAFILGVQKEEEEKKKDFFQKLVEFFDPPKPTEEEEAAEKELGEELLAWGRAFLKENVFLGSVSAGQDGRSIHLMSYPGFTLPSLLYLKANSDGSAPEEIKLVIYLDGQWIDLSLLLAEDPAVADPAAESVGNLFSGMISELSDGKQLIDVLRDHIFQAPAGQTTVIPNTGLENITLDITMPGNESKPPVPNNTKSRPKLPAEEAAGETETANEESHK